MAGFINGAVARERAHVLLDQIDAAQIELRELSIVDVGSVFRVTMAERLENQQRANRGLMYRVFAELVHPPDESRADPDVIDKLWARLRIAPTKSLTTGSATSASSRATRMSRSAASTSASRKAPRRFRRSKTSFRRPDRLSNISLYPCGPVARAMWRGA